MTVIGGGTTVLPPVFVGEVPAAVAESTLDLELLAVRMVDAGHAEAKLGPAYRLWFRNNSASDINQAFELVAMAAAGQEVSKDSPLASQQVVSIKAGETQVLDLRLPMDANGSVNGKAAFPMLYLAVDSKLDVAEKNEENNAAVMNRAEIAMIDPLIAAMDRNEAPAGEAVTIGGEGFGYQPGAVIVSVGGFKLQAEVLAWTPGAVQFRLPNLVGGAMDAQIVLTRTDGASAEPAAMKIAAAK